MSNHESLVEQARPSILKATVLGLAFFPVCVVLALIECFALRAAGLPFGGIRDITLLAVLNVMPLALVLLGLVRLERRWFVGSATAGLAIVAVAFFSLMTMRTGSIAPTSAELHADAVPGVQQPAQRPDVPLAPKSSLPLPTPLPSMAAPGNDGSAKAPPPTLAPPRPPASAAPAVDGKPSSPAVVPGEGDSASADLPAAAAPAPAAPAPTASPRPHASIRPFSIDRPVGGGARPAPPAASTTDEEASAKGSAAAGGTGGGAGKLSPPTKTAKAKAPLRFDEVARMEREREPSFGSRPPTFDAPSPLPLAPPPPSPLPAKPDSAANPSVYWNSWFAGGAGPASNILLANNTYTYSLDLSAFDYAALRKLAQSSSTPVDQALKEVIENLSIPEIILNIKPIVPEGSGLRIIDGATSFTMKVDLRKVREPNTAAAQQFADGSLAIEEFSKQVSAGSIQMAVSAESKGCATIAFAIFKGLLPLDHLVHRVSIGADAASAPVCDSEDPGHRNALSGGLDSLREVALGMEGTGASITAAAALHVFDFAGYSMAVFVDGRAGKSQSVYGWQTASSLVDYIKMDNFRNLVRKARKDAANNKPGSYIPAAHELAKVLFSTKPGNATEFEARNAEAAFKSIVSESAGSPVIIVRVASSLVDGQSRSIYVPLGILGAKGPGAVLDKPIIVVQPMALERHPSRDKCIGDWTFAVPNVLENVPASIMSPSFFPAKFPGQRIQEMDKLREFLASDETAAIPLLGRQASPRTLGFVVLAHQDEGFLWFGESGDRIIPQDIEKRFPAGSVGIFAACSAAAAKGRNAALLQRLNEQGIDSMIASPFTIDAGYGVVFASSFAEIVEESSARGERPTILKLFDLTIERTAKKFKDKTNGDYGELGLEYVLLGNPAITLCPP